ncbi:hypothetical protein K438DRAFT_1781634 [Mycena galopus ATCC 62051]|nr:hypothetical protein K438DRAFT_1781634 [Mycena galopus ATCC 62051]
MSESDSTFSQPQQTQLKSRASAQLRKAKRRVSLHKYAESHADTLRAKARERMKRLRESHQNVSKEELAEARALTDFKYRERFLRKYRETYGTRSYHDFYQPICKFFGDGHLTGVTLVDETSFPRKKSFALKITDEHKRAKRLFREGRRVKIIITDESIAA